MRRIFRVLTSVPLALTLSSCASVQTANSKKWEDLGVSEEFLKEKRIFMERLGLTDFCWTYGVESFLKDPSATPLSKCVYPSSRLVIENDGVISEHKTLKQAVKQLKVLQVTPKGYVVTASDGSASTVIFVHRTDEDSLVDGSYLDETNWKVFEYSGPFAYESLAETKTVRSFRKISDERLERARKDLKVYGLRKEFLIQNRLWDYF